jgi:hypothetical protein
MELLKKLLLVSLIAVSAQSITLNAAISDRDRRAEARSHRAEERNRQEERNKQMSMGSVVIAQPSLGDKLKHGAERLYTFVRRHQPEILNGAAVTAVLFVPRIDSEICGMPCQTVNNAPIALATAVVVPVAKAIHKYHATKVKHEVGKTLAEIAFKVADDQRDARQDALNNELNNQ